jgi:single-stranded DNA-binding protein
MATISLIGKVVGKAGEPAVAVREIKDLKIASFSVNDREYCYFKNKDDNPGQFYRVEVTGKTAEIAADRIQLGSWVSVTGQPVWRQYNGNKYLDVKNAKITLAEDRKTATGDEMPF